MSELTKNGACKVTAFVALLFLLAWVMAQLIWVLKLLVISLLIVYVLYPIVGFCKVKLRLGHTLAVILTFLLFLLLMTTLVSLVVPVVQNEIQEIIRDIPYYARQIQFYVEEFTEYLLAFGLEREHLEFIINFPSNIPRLVDEVALISISMVSSAVDIFFVLFIVFYLLFDFQSVRSAVIKLVPAVYQDHAEAIMSIVDRNFGGYIRGNIIRCTSVGVMTGSILMIFGVPYALLLGVLAGVLNIILYIGPYIAAIPALLLSFSPHTPSPIIIIAIYFFVQGIDAIVLSPLLLGRAVRLKPITVIVCLLIGQQLAGFLGIILSTPLAGIARSLLEYFRDERGQNEKSHKDRSQEPGVRM
ncbi:MAG: AI-2E family transporter [Bacillota bacterium]